MAQSVHTTSVVLEPAAEKVIRMTANPPFPFQLAPEKGRTKLVEVQSGNIPRPEVDIEDIMVPGGQTGQVPVRIVKPRGAGRFGGAGGGLGDRLRSAAQEMMRTRGIGGMLPARAVTTVWTRPGSPSRVTRQAPTWRRWWRCWPLGATGPASPGRYCSIR